MPALPFSTVSCGAKRRSQVTCFIPSLELRDEIPGERQQGIDAGRVWRGVAEASVVYTDRGISKGMTLGIEAAEAAGIPVEYRTLGKR